MPQHPQHSTWVDEGYLVIGGHLEKGMIDRIVRHEYVNFARLIPRNRLQREEDHRMEIVNKGGSTYFVPRVR